MARHQLAEAQTQAGWHSRMVRRSGLTRFWVGPVTFRLPSKPPAFLCGTGFQDPVPLCGSGNPAADLHWMGEH